MSHIQLKTNVYSLWPRIQLLGGKEDHKSGLIWGCKPWIELWGAPHTYRFTACCSDSFYLFIYFLSAEPSRTPLTSSLEFHHLVCRCFLYVLFRRTHQRLFIPGRSKIQDILARVHNKRLLQSEWMLFGWFFFFIIYHCILLLTKYGRLSYHTI